nr:RNA-directed DNA polymerase, eukaryota [Tanacetum cinerariifolium]
MGDFNEVRSSNERRGSCFNPFSASRFDNFILDAGLVDVSLEDRHLSDHRPILLREVRVDFGPVPFRKEESTRVKKEIAVELSVIDKALDGGVIDDTTLLRRLDLKRQLIDIQLSDSKDFLQKSKIKWAIEGDKNSKFFHGVVNKRRSQLAIRGIFVDGLWCTKPIAIKTAFFSYFANRFKKPVDSRFKVNFQFPKKLLQYQADELEGHVSYDEIRKAVWDCGTNKSPGPDGFTFEFFKKEILSLKNKGFDFWEHCKRRIGNGCSTRFWLDHWLGEFPLYAKFPRLFVLEMDQGTTVNSKLNASIVDTFRRQPRGGREQAQLDELRSMLDSVSLSNSTDRWFCSISGDGVFRVKDVRTFLDDMFLPRDTHSPWIKAVPAKVNILIWRDRKNCLPTRSNLAIRDIPIVSLLCPVCLAEQEDTSHIFFRCNMVQNILNRVTR